MMMKYLPSLLQHSKRIVQQKYYTEVFCNEAQSLYSESVHTIFFGRASYEKSKQVIN